eukprot:GHVN01046533.1.p1 GENE.GHVN01046533.1~~GHVN01046533.1.p1  ORF type:complete len:126 (+),score=2.05 GHVN01046533.1:54-431(+)
MSDFLGILQASFAESFFQFLQYQLEPGSSSTSCHLRTSPSTSWMTGRLYAFNIHYKQDRSEWSDPYSTDPVVASIHPVAYPLPLFARHSEAPQCVAILMIRNRIKSFSHIQLKFIHSIRLSTIVK